MPWCSEVESGGWGPAQHVAPTPNDRAAASRDNGENGAAPAELTNKHCRTGVAEICHSLAMDGEDGDVVRRIRQHVMV